MSRPRPKRDGAAGRPFFGRMPSLEGEIADFDQDVLERSQRCAVLAAFWAPWCEPCVRLRARLEPIVERHAGRVALKFVNIEMHPGVLESQGVEGLPLVKAYLQGRALGELTGVPGEDDIEEWVDGLSTAVEAAGLVPPARGRPSALKPPRA